MKGRRDLLPRKTVMYWQLWGILMGYSKEDIDAFCHWAVKEKNAETYFNKLGRWKEVEDFWDKAGIKGAGYIPSPHTLDRVKRGTHPKDIVKEINERRIISYPFPGRRRTRVFIHPVTGERDNFTGFKASNTFIMTKDNITEATEVYRKYYGADKPYILMKIKLKQDKLENSGKPIASLRK